MSIYTHPVLRSDTNDIKGSAEMQVKMSDSGDIMITPIINNNEIETLISSGNAAVYLDIINKQCYHRRQLMVPINEQKLELDPVKHPSGKYTVYGYIRAAQDELDYNLKSFHSDYSGADFNLVNGGIISYLGNFSFEYIKDFQTPQEKDSIFKMDARPEFPAGAFTVDYIGDVILLKMNLNDHNKYYKTINAIDTSILVNVYILPALMLAIMDCVNEQYEGFHWAETIIKVLKERELDFEDPLYAAQRILADPVNAITKSLTKLSIQDDDDE